MTGKKKKPPIQTAMRLDEELLERIDKLAEQLSDPAMRLTRSDAFRKALHRGLAAYDADLKKKP